MRKTLLCSALAAVLGSAGMASQAAMLMIVDRLTLDAGVAVYDSYGNLTNVSSGSYFVCDCNGDLNIAGVEKTAMAPGVDNGIVISFPRGFTQAPGEIDNGFTFFGLIGSHFTTSPVTGGTTDGLDMSGWTLRWNYMDIPLGDGAWTPGNCAAAGVACSGYADGVAVFNWSGIYGDRYTLDYASRVPSGHPSGFDSVPFFVHLEGMVEGLVIDDLPQVPVPTAAWLFASGLVALGTARRRSRRLPG